MPLDPRAEVLRELRGVISHATAGEIQRAVEFLKFARMVRVGKHDLRHRSRVAQYRPAVQRRN